VSRYCRAYRLGELRAFDRWAGSAAECAADLDDGAIVYLCDDFTVVRTPVLVDPQLIWNEVDLRWREFCTTRLHFDLPADLGQPRG
jgi:hypothetical protein